MQLTKTIIIPVLLKLTGLFLFVYIMHLLMSVHLMLTQQDLDILKLIHETV